jgi:hypothetical protein
MKKSTRRRPELEPLETMVLMSTFVAEARQVVPPISRVLVPAAPVGHTVAFQVSGLPSRTSQPASSSTIGPGNPSRFAPMRTTVTTLDGYGGYHLATGVTTSPVIISGATSPHGGASLFSQGSSGVARISTASQQSLGGGTGPIRFVINGSGTITRTTTTMGVARSSGLIKPS